MKKKNLFVMSGIAAICALGFGLNVSANTVGQEATIPVVEPTAATTQAIETPEVVLEDTTVITYEDTTTDEVTTTPCAYGHENCDGVHANGECPYGNESGSGMGYHHEEDHGNGNGLHDGSGHGTHSQHHTASAE